ncbi:uberolysin/carnocyclin family circular bacteriocin [Sporolactobacillus vineae]|jgi:circularin A/uberolysin family circular bacteriocin|uniref:uberolysin/carnocyclin family circular bacteriocin n=1 Tax=Sporolactobacillus vineae TaxID=444463 RepID=UPI000289E856|nr:uberolysin/carnocyclin family circular bacteriocin [Sporolactobacillus vineae]
MTLAKNSLLLKIFIVMAAVLGLAFTLFYAFSTPYLASTLGISTYAAKKAIDLISAASSIYAIIGLIAAIAGGGGIGIGILFTAKALIKKFGKKYAAAW